MRDNELKKGIIRCLLMIFSMIGLYASAVYAEDKMEKKAYAQDITRMNISAQDKMFLLADDGYAERYKELVEDGWILQDIKIEDCEIVPDNTNMIQPFATYTTSEGKIVTSSYVQPTRSTTKYNNKIYKKAEDLKTYISFASNFINAKWSWIASTLFGINTSQFTVWFNNGYQKLEENATYYLKDAYYKEGTKYWIGYEAMQLKIAGTVMTYYRDANNAPHQKSKDYSKTLKSFNYDKSNVYLVSLAKKYYNTGWVKDQISYSSTYRLN